MTSYKHTQTGYLTSAITFVLLIFFIWVQITARAEPQSVDSGANFAVTAIMVLILLILGSFSSLTVCIENNSLKVTFGYGIFRTSFLLDDIASVKAVKNHWYYGWGVRIWFWPYMWMYTVSGFDAVEISLKNGKKYRIGTDESKKLEEAISLKIRR